MFKIKLRSDGMPVVWIVATISSPHLSPSAFKDAAIGFSSFTDIPEFSLALDVTAGRHKISIWDELEVIKIEDENGTNYSELVEALQENDDFLDMVWDDLDGLNFIEEEE